ncbi:MAG: endonuclease/exonuclease/phosphatase family protein [Bdellovibrionales bacterium]|nr:endonuclease/exonuclease/phosphatase family protein [Bdellovibrionales bacterium]
MNAEVRSKTIRVLSYNIHKGFSLTNRKFVLNQIREAVRLVKADLVFLQEVTGHNSKHASKTEDWPNQSQFEFLADSVWSHYAYGKNAVYAEGHHGNAILSHYPIISWENENISTNPYEQRGVLHAVIEVPDLKTSLDCLCVHLDLFQRGRTKQLEWLAQRISRMVHPNQPFLICGDFNDWRESATDQMLRSIQAEEAFETLGGRSPRTFPSFFPLLRLDRMYYRGLSAVDTQTLTGSPWKKLSDHAALYGEFVLTSKVETHNSNPP